MEYKTRYNTHRSLDKLKLEIPDYATLRISTRENEKLTPGGFRYWHEVEYPIPDNEKKRFVARLVFRQIATYLDITIEEVFNNSDIIKWLDSTHPHILDWYRPDNNKEIVF